MTVIVTSDVHLGSRHFRRELFLQFLDALPPGATLVLNGDTVDHRRRRLPPDHLAVVDRLVAEAGRRRVVWLQGNHDARYRPLNPGALEFAQSFAVGRRLFVQHGFYFDHVLPYHRLFIMAVRLGHQIRIWLGAEAMHVAQYAKRWEFLYRVLRRNVMRNALEHAREHGYAAVVCGHTHFAEDTVADGIRYLNTGSWTELPVHYVRVTDVAIEFRLFADGSGKVVTDAL
jgi:UDP-2,3-diacylglucosamine pyrophosphatase LpxH